MGDVAPAHGASLWGVYVVVAAPGAPELESAAAPLRERGINVSVGELGCDGGAAAALAVAPMSWVARSSAAFAAVAGSAASDHFAVAALGAVALLARVFAIALSGLRSRI